MTFKPPIANGRLAKHTFRRARIGLMAALAVDNFGSGLFLPLVMLYQTQVVGLSTTTASKVLVFGTLLGLIVPFAVSTFLDRQGPQRIVVSSQLIQAAGMLCYLFAGLVGRGNTALAMGILAALLVATGTQTFYSSLSTLVATLSGSDAKDPAFAQVGMVRASAFSIGSLISGGLLAWAGDGQLRSISAVNATSFVVAAILLSRLIHPDTGKSGVGDLPASNTAECTPLATTINPLRDIPFLVLILMIALTALAGDFFLVGFSFWALQQLQSPAWVPGVCVALLTLLNSTCAALVVRRTLAWTRPYTIGIGTAISLLWCAACAASPAIPHQWLPIWLIFTTLLLATSVLLIGSRAMAMAEASAPPAARGRYMAIVQYSFNVAQLIAPLLIGLFAIAPWLPWASIAVNSTFALLLLPWLARRLPSHAIRHRY